MVVARLPERSSQDSSTSSASPNQQTMDLIPQARSRACHAGARFEPAPHIGYEWVMVGCYFLGAAACSYSYRLYPCSWSSLHWHFRLNCHRRLCLDYKAVAAASWATPRACTVPGKGRAINESTDSRLPSVHEPAYTRMWRVAGG